MAKSELWGELASLYIAAMVFLTCALPNNAEKAGKKHTQADDFDDAGSIASSNTGYSSVTAEQDLMDSEADAFHACIDDTFENRLAECSEFLLGGLPVILPALNRTT